MPDRLRLRRGRDRAAGSRLGPAAGPRRLVSRLRPAASSVGPLHRSEGVHVIRKFMLGVVGLAVAIGLVRNLIHAPGRGAAGTVVLSLVGYVVWRAWGSVAGDARRVRHRLFGGGHRRSRVDTL